MKNKYLNILAILSFCLFNQISKADQWVYSDLNNQCMFSYYHPPENDGNESGIKYGMVSEKPMKGFEKYHSLRINTKYLTVEKYMYLLKRTFTKIHAKIPHLSPNETKWLEAELNGGSKRSLKARESGEHAQQSILETTHYKLYLIKTIYETEDSKSKKEYLLHLAESFFTNTYKFMAAYTKLVELKIIKPFPKNWNILGFNDRNFAKGEWENIGRLILNCYVIDS